MHVFPSAEETLLEGQCRSGHFVIVNSCDRGNEYGNGRGKAISSRCGDDKSGEWHAAKIVGVQDGLSINSLSVSRWKI